MSRTTKRPSPSLDRRLFMAGAAATLGLPAVAGASNGDYVYYIGGMKAGGVTPLTYASAYDTFTLGKLVPVTDNASFGVYNSKFKRYYVVNEQDNGTIGVFTGSSDSGRMTKKGEVSSHGSNPCYVSLDATQTYLAVANYNTGDIAVYRIDPSTALPLEPAIIKQNSGSGPVADRQAGPHAHWVKFSADQKFIYSIDLGTDQILGYSFNATTGAVGDSFVAFKADAGFGPRHMILHPSGQVAHLVGELANAVVTLRPQADGTFIGTQWVSTLPEDFKDHNQAAHIALSQDGSRLYVSNRGHNSIAVFALDPTGRLAPLQIAPTGGDWPRHFHIIEGVQRVIVANQNSNNLTIMGMHVDGTLWPLDVKLQVTSPVFIGQFA